MTREFVPALGRPAEASEDSLCFVVRRAEVLVRETANGPVLPRFAELDGIDAGGAHFLGSLGRRRLLRARPRTE